MRLLGHMLLQAKRSIGISFLVLAALLMLLVALKPEKYEAHMSLLVRNERADLLVSADPHQNSIQHGEITEEDINSEVELLSSTELLQRVVVVCGLDREYRGSRSPAAAIERATRKLSKNLTITPVRKSAVINIAYAAKDRSLSVRVLDQLAQEFLAKHSALDTAGTAAAFFRTKSASIEQQLRHAQNQRALALQAYGFTLLPEGRQLSLQQMLDMQKSKDDLETSKAEVTSRLAQVEAQQRGSEARITTQARVESNPYSVERLNTMLAELENRRTELATKFRPGDPLLTQVEKQIADTRAALTDAEKLHAQNTTTDVNPIRQALDSEEQRLRETQAGMRSRELQLDHQLSQHAEAMNRMERASIVVDEIDRTIRELQESLEVYRNKAIAAGIAEDLDAAKISNVVVETPPIVPVLPVSSPFNYVTAVLLAFLLSLAVGLVPQLLSERTTSAYSDDAMVAGSYAR